MFAESSLMYYMLRIGLGERLKILLLCQGAMRERQGSSPRETVNTSAPGCQRLVIVNCDSLCRNIQGCSAIAAMTVVKLS